MCQSDNSLALLNEVTSSETNQVFPYIAMKACIPENYYPHQYTETMVSHYVQYTINLLMEILLFSFLC